MFYLTVLLAPLTSLLSNVLQFVHVFYPPCSCTWNSLLKQLRQPKAPPSLSTATDSSPPLALSSHQLTLNSKLFSLNNPFLLSLWHKLLSALWPLDLANGFQLCHFSLCRLFSIRSSTPVSPNKPPSVITDWQALYRHSKSPHLTSLRMLSGSIIIIIMNHKQFFASLTTNFKTRILTTRASGSQDKATTAHNAEYNLMLNYL